MCGAESLGQVPGDAAAAGPIYLRRRRSGEPPGGAAAADLERDGGGLKWGRRGAGAGEFSERQLGFAREQEQ